MIIFSNHERAGMLPVFLSHDDPRPAAKQIDDNYRHGGGWKPMQGFKLKPGIEGQARIMYPGDPPLREVARARLRDEIIILFEADFVAIIQPTHSMEIARVD